MLTRLQDMVDAVHRRHPAVAFPYAVIKKFGEDRAGQLAALIAYYTFFSIFPLLLAFTTIVGLALSSHPDLQSQLLDSAVGQFPVIGDQLRTDVGGIPGSGLALAVGLVLALWAGMGAVMAMRNAMDGVWNVPMRDRPGFVPSRLRALAMLAVFGVAVVAITVAGNLVRAVSDAGAVQDLNSFVVSALLGAGLFLAAFAVLTTAEVAWRDLLPGAILAGLAWAVLQLVGAAFVRHQVQGAAATSGVFALVLGLLSWLFVQAQVTVLAAEVNVVRRERLWPRSLTGRDLTAGDQAALRRYAEVEQRIEGETVTVALAPPDGDADAETDAEAAPPEEAHEPADGPDRDRDGHDEPCTPDDGTDGDGRNGSRLADHIRSWLTPSARHGSD